MQSLAAHAPEMKKLQDRYKGDKERLNQEMMKFYRENKINPFASCLPLLAQLPVFLSLFYMLQADLRRDICPEVQPPAPANPVACGPGGDASFFFIPDLTDNATGGVLIALIVLYVGSQLASTLLMSVTASKQQKYIFLALPFVFVAFIINFPAGLLVYWITTNLWTIAQQYVIRRRVGAPIKPPPLQKRPDGSEPSFLEKLTGGMAGGPAPSSTPAKATGGSGGGSGGETPRRTTPPPKSPRKKKKRSGRRR
jgi:YidC/Oxa1 family membrane protein insertase